MAHQRRFSYSSFRIGDVILVRHLALSLTTLVIFLLRDTAEAGYAVFWIIGVIAVLNLGMGLLDAPPRLAGAMSALSAASGLLGWAALTYDAGGAGSPLAFGFGFEIILSVLQAAPRMTCFVTAGAVTALWAQQLLLGSSGPVPPGLWLQTAVLISLGGLVAIVASRGGLRRARLTNKIDSLQRRLDLLKTELEQSRLPGSRGAPSVRPSQHLLNLVENLRVLSQHLRSELKGSRKDRETAQGLLSSIERLEGLARAALRSSRRPKEGPSDRAAGQDVFASLDEVIEQTARSFPSIRWITKAPSRLPDVQMPTARLSEIFQILVRNAAEGSLEAGEVHLSMEPRRRHLELQIHEQGGSPSATRKFDADRTRRANQRPAGRYRLFLARQLLRAYGGRLNARTAPGGGAKLSLRLPLADDGDDNEREPETGRQRPLGSARKPSLEDVEVRPRNTSVDEDRH